MKYQSDPKRWKGEMNNEPKTTLTPEEKVRAAAAKVIYGTTDAEIALVLGVTNAGRVNEAMKAVLAPLELAKPGYKTLGD